VWIQLDLNLLLQSDARGQDGYRQHFRRYVAWQIRDAHVVESGRPCLPIARGPQNSSPLDESRLWTGNLRSFGVAVSCAPVAPGGIRSFAVATSRLQLDWSVATPPNPPPRSDQLRVAYRRLITPLLHDRFAEPEKFS